MLPIFLLSLHLLQATLSGTIKDAQTNEPVDYAQVTILENGRSTQTDSLGNFSFPNLEPGKYVLQITRVGYASSMQRVELGASDSFVQLLLEPESGLTEEVVITAIRANRQTPVTQYNMSQKEIEDKYFGHDIPTLINNSPSVQSYSDAGNGIGYSYFRLRGIDQTRINFTVNGIPINDPETQGYYFNNFADLANSAQSIQIQRGVGTSTNGSAAFGGSINMLTTDLLDSTRFNLQTGYGSFNSSRLSAEYYTGKIKNKFAFYGRMSSVNSDGYRERSGANIRSYFVSGAYYGKKSILKLNSFGGLERSELAYIATPKSVLDTNRRYNPLSKDETDMFQQSFHQLQYTYEFNRHLNISSSAYFVRGGGAFDIKIPGYPYFYLNMPDADTNATSTDVINRYKLDTYFYGGMAFLNYKKNKISLNYGLHANYFISDHFAEVAWATRFPASVNPNHQIYFNTGYKTDLSTFVKFSYALSPKLIASTDLQLRSTGFKYRAQDKPIFRDTFQVEDMSWLFFNPKLGLRYHLNSKVSFYLSGGRTTREPTRVDLLGDDRANFNVAQADVKPETVYDLEVGNEIRSGKLKMNTNLFFMEFRNEIAATGALNLFGYSIRKNVDQSFRRGLELDWTWQLHKNWALINSSVFSYNKIKTYTQNFVIYDSTGVDTYTRNELTFNNVTPVLTPSVMINQGLRFNPLSWLSLEVIGKYVGKMYLDNSETDNLSIPATAFADLRIGLKLNQWIRSGDHTLSLQLNNITNTLYYNGGTPNHFYTQYTSGLDRTTFPSYFPAATRNFFLTLNMKF